MRAEPPCLFGDSSWFWEASSPTLRASACPFGLRRSSGAILTIPIITLNCSGESLESCASSPKAGVPQAMRKDLCFLFSWHCLHRVWWGWQGSLKPLWWHCRECARSYRPGCWPPIGFIVQSQAKGVFLQWRKHQFAVSLMNTCNSCWGCPGGQGSQARLGARLVQNPSCSWIQDALSMGTKLRTIYFWQFAWTGELRLVFKNKSKKLGFHLLEKSFKCTKWFCNYLYLAKLIISRERKFRSQGNSSTCKSPGTDDHTYCWNAFNQRKWLTGGAAWQIAQYLTKQSPLELVHFHGNQNVAARGKWKFCKNSHPCYALFHLEKFSIRIQRTQGKEITERALLGKYHFICKGKMSLLNFHTTPSENFKLLQR